MKQVYLDYNATTPLDSRVFEAMRPYFMETFGNPSSPHRYGRLAKQALEDSRRVVARTIGAEPEEIVFTSGGTESDNLALRGVAYRKGSNRKGHMIVSSIEHHAVIKTCNILEKDGFSVTYLPVDGQGQVDPDDVKKSIRHDTILISVMFANNETGVLEPVGEIGNIARESGILFHCDAVQAVGKMPVDVEALRTDLLSISSHKIYGPKGIGSLFIRSGVELSPVITGGHHEMGWRAGTENIAAIVGFAHALKIAVEDMDVYQKTIFNLRHKLESCVLDRIDQVKIYSADVCRLPHTSCMGFASVEAESVLLHLDLKGIAASSGSACTTGEPEPSHVLRAMGIPSTLAQGSIRISLGRENTEDDIHYTVDVLEQVIDQLRKISSQWSNPSQKAV